MKKFLLSIAMVALTVTANAQEKKEVSTYKPNAGDVTASFGFAGGLDNPTYGLREGQLRGRYFQSADFAYRGGLNLSSVTNSTDEDNSTGNTAIELAFGVEKHLNGTKRLSPYYGGEVFVGYSKASAKVAGVDVDGIKGRTRFGIAGVIGADYYFVENVFLGVEASWGLGYSSQDKASDFFLGNGTAGIKLGFVF